MQIHRSQNTSAYSIIVKIALLTAHHYYLEIATSQSVRKSYLMSTSKLNSLFLQSKVKHMVNSLKTALNLSINHCNGYGSNPLQLRTPNVRFYKCKYKK